MPIFSVHELFVSMNAANSDRDYRQKEQQAWSVWDWLCALKDGLTGRGNDPEDARFQALRGTLFALTALRTVQPPVTEADLAANYGRRIFAFRQELANVQSFTGALSAEESDLASAFRDNVEPGNDLNSIIYFEQQRRIRRWREDARRYMHRLIQERRDEQARPNAEQNQAKLVDITSRLFIAGYLSSQLDEHENDGEGKELEGFNPDTIRKISDKMTRDETTAYYSAILTEVIAAEVPAPNEEALTEFVGRVEHSCNDLQLLAREPGEHVLSDYDDRALRLAVYREVKSALDATATGYSWFFRVSRDRNSDAYEDVRRELQRQIDCLETGQPLGSADDIRLLGLLNTYTTGREKPFYDFAKIRQENMLKLYAVILQTPADRHLTNYPASAEGVQERYNNARGNHDDEATDYVSLDRPPYKYRQENHPKSAAARYNAALDALNALYDRHTASHLPLTAVEQLAVRDNILKLAALRSIMTRERSGMHTEVEEDRLLEEMTAVSLSRTLPVMGAVNAAIRRPESMREIIDAFDVVNLNEPLSKYYRDPAHYHDPLQDELQEITYPTAGERLNAAVRELEALEYAPGRGLSAKHAADYARLCGEIMGLNRLISRSAQGRDLHVSDDEAGHAATVASRELRLSEIAEKAGIDSRYAREFAMILASPELTYADISDRADRYANGYIHDQLDAAQDEFRLMPAGQNVPDQEAVKNKLVRLAALYDLQYVRGECFPGRQFASSLHYTSQEIRDAENRVRADQDFMDALDGHLATTDEVKQLVGSLASSRYRIELSLSEARLRAYTQALQTANQEEIRRLQNEFRTGFARQIALRNIQHAFGSFSTPVTDEELEAETARVRLSDDFLAVDRFIRTDRNNIYLLYNDFASPETLPARLLALQAGPVPQPADNTIGSSFQSARTTLLATLTTHTVAGRSAIYTAFTRMMACRALAMEDPDGQYGLLRAERYTQKQIEIATAPANQSLLNRIVSDPLTAGAVAGLLNDHTDLYQLKVDRDRAVAAGQAFTDPLLSLALPLGNYRAQEVFDQGMKAFTDALGTLTPGLALSSEQKTKVLRAVAEMIAARKAPNGSNGLMPDDYRRARIAELTAGETDESRLLLRAVERAALDGAKTAELISMVGAESAELDTAIARFGLQTPAKWAQDAQEKLQAVAAFAPDRLWTEEDRNILVRTYARLHAMRQLAKDPAKADVPVTLAEADAAAEKYLSMPFIRDDVKDLFLRPQESLTVKTVAARLSALKAMPPAVAPYDAASRLSLRMALENLKRRDFPEALVSDRELEAELARVRESFAFKVLTHESNAKLPAVEQQDLPEENYEIALESAVLNAPGRKAVVLGDTPENSFAGLRLLAQEEMRHDTALGMGEAAERQLFAELYVIALLNDGTWEEGALPGLPQIADYAKVVMDLPDFKNAMAFLDQSPEQKQQFLGELMRGAPAAQLTDTLNRLAEQQRKAVGSFDVHKADLGYDVRSAMVQRTFKRLRGMQPYKEWPDAKKAAGLNSLVPSQEQARAEYIRFLATNRLYMRNPGRSFFSETELNAAVKEVEDDPEIKADLETALASPIEMRLCVFNLAPVQYWTEIEAMESGRTIIMQSGGGNRTAGLQTILFSLASVAEARLNGRDISGRMIPNAELFEERNRVAFTDNYIALENALRTDINELDRIKAVFKLPPDQFKTAFNALTDEYKQKYPEADIPDENSIGYEYLKAKRAVRALEGKDLTNDEAARKALAHNVREIFSLRNVILNSHYDVTIRKNTVDEADSRRRSAAVKAEEAYRHTLDMLLGTENALAERMKDPQIAKAFIDLTKDAEDLRRLYGRKMAARRNITDPLEEEVVKQNLGANVPSHAERREALLSRIPVSFGGEDESMRNARLQIQIAALFNLTLHAAGTDPRKMPTDDVLAAQANRIMGIADFKHAVNYLSAHENELTAFLEKAKAMDAEAFARELDTYSARAQLAADPKAEPHPNIMFRLKMTVQKEANEGLQLSATGQGVRSKWSSNTDRDRALENFLHYSAVNRLMQTYPYRLYFSEEEISDSFLLSANDERLMQEFAKSLAGGPSGVRADLFTYSGLGFRTSVEALEDFAEQLPKPQIDLSSKKQLLVAVVQQFGFLTELMKTGSLENNYFAGDMQKAVFRDYPKTPDAKAIYAALVLDPNELARINARLLPLRGDAYMQEYERIAAKCRGPLDLDARAAKDKEILLGLGKTNDNFIKRNEPETMRVCLANLLTAALYRDLPKAERPNAEAFLEQRDEIMDLPEFRLAADWLAMHPAERESLGRENLSAAELAARLDDACKKQHAAKNQPGTPGSNILFKLQWTFMDKFQGGILRKNVIDEAFIKDGQEKTRREFLDYCTYDALLEEHPDRLFFTQAEFREARKRFENDPAFMEQLKTNTELPITARKNFSGYRSLAWPNYRAAEHMVENGIKMLKPLGQNARPADKENYLKPAVDWLAQTAGLKLNGAKSFYSGKELIQATDQIKELPEFKAIIRAVYQDPSVVKKLINEVFCLNGEAFRNKLHQTARELDAKYPPANGQRTVGDVSALPPYRPASKAPEQAPAKPGANRIIAEEPKNENRINVAGEPKNENRINVASEPKPPVQPAAKKPAPASRPVFRQSEPVLVVPDPNYKNAPAMAQLQSHTAQLERALHLQQTGGIPANNPEFVKATYLGILKAAALNTLAQKPAYANKEVDKEMLEFEMDRLKDDPSYKALPDVIASGKAGLLLEGVKHLEGKPEDLNGFLILAAKDPAAAEQRLRQHHPKAAPQYVSVPQLPKTEVVNDLLPSLEKVTINGGGYDTPLGRYKYELSLLNATMREQHSSPAQYKKDLQKSLTRIYGLRQIIAETEDPNKVDKLLSENLDRRAEILNADPAFQNSIRGVEVNDLYIGRVVSTITKTASFAQMNQILQRDGEKLFRHEIKTRNKELEKGQAGTAGPEKESAPKPTA